MKEPTLPSVGMTLVLTLGSVSSYSLSALSGLMHHVVRPPT